MGDNKELHNKIVGKIVRSIVDTPLDNGGSVIDVLILTESVLTGVILSTTKPGGDDFVLDGLMKGVKKRLAETRLKNLPTAGEA